MTAGRWRQIRDIFDRVADGEYKDNWRELCGGDAELEGEVERLLSFHEGDRDWFEPRGTSAATVAGNYRLLRQIGEGGMGAVYLGERADGAYLQQVAVKVLDPRFLGRRELERFQQERQILSELRHPAIAQLLDGGEHNGTPYLVMELVDGVPVTDYCRHEDRRRVLLLFLQLCDAVQYAHSRLVVHRDLKPSNVLVTPEGQPKLLDFGIAKPLTTAGSQATEAWFTPGYGSPEQLTGKAITTAADVFSLGALFYELMAGRPAFAVEGKPFAAALAEVCERDPAPPTSDRDLNAIAAKALRKAAEERYASVEQLASDIRNYLEGRPVEARRGSWFYYSTRFVRRNRLAMAAALTIVGIGGAGLAATLHQRTIAERRFNEVRKIANAILFDYQESLENVGGAVPTRARMLRDAREYLDNLNRDAGGDEKLIAELATAYEQAGAIAGLSNFNNLGNGAEAEESLLHSVALRRRLVGLAPGNAEYQRQLSLAFGVAGDLYADRGDAERALAQYREGPH